MKKNLKDDPELDGTPFAHPAWWRGRDSGVDGVCKRIERILEGKDDGSGVMLSLRLERIRRKILDLVTSHG